MQSFSTSKSPSEADVLPSESLKISTDVQHLEKLLNKIFGDEIEKVCDAEPSNLIEFPLQQETQIVSTVVPSAPATAGIDLFDFSPAQADLLVGDTEIFKSSPMMLRSIIEEDDYEADSRLQQMVDIQRKELVQLRKLVKDREFDIRTRDLELAANADQLKYMPELFSKALLVGELKSQLNQVQEALETEQATHEQSRDLLFKTQARVDRIKDTFWFKLGRSLGFCLE
ncbi:MAG: hypothetical protein Q8T09_12540 [Candidatus Melainabacteria bacterium]|nr:hypothetical protein [Candidatus Melainabacteria bacterium]